MALTPLLSFASVAEQLGVSRATVLRWTRAGVLPGFRLPSGALRYREGDLEEWLGSRATPRGEVASHLHAAPPVR